MGASFQSFTYLFNNVRHQWEWEGVWYFTFFHFKNRFSNFHRENVYHQNEARWLDCSIIYEVNKKPQCWTKTVLTISDQWCLSLKHDSPCHRLQVHYSPHIHHRYKDKRYTMCGCMHKHTHQLVNTHTALLCSYGLDLHKTGSHLQKGKKWSGLRWTPATVKSSTRREVRASFSPNSTTAAQAQSQCKIQLKRCTLNGEPVKINVLCRV